MSLLELFKQGAKITFQDGMYMQGDPKTSYTEVGTEEAGTDGLQILNEDRVKKALAQIDTLRDERDQTDEE